MRCPLLAALSTMLLAAAEPAAEALPRPYPFEHCLVSQEPLGPHARRLVHEGWEVRVCCSACQRRFERNPGFYLERLRAAAPAQPSEGGR